MTPIHSFTIDNRRFQILFTRLSGRRLSQQQDGLELVDYVVCEFLDEDLLPMAIGRAICADDDLFSWQKGIILALARAMDDAVAQSLMTFLESWDIPQALYATFPSAEPQNVPDDILQQVFRANTAIDAAKLLLPYIGVSATLTPGSAGSEEPAPYHYDPSLYAEDTSIDVSSRDNEAIRQFDTQVVPDDDKSFAMVDRLLDVIFGTSLPTIYLYTLNDIAGFWPRSAAGAYVPDFDLSMVDFPTLVQKRKSAEVVISVEGQWNIWQLVVSRPESEFLEFQNNLTALYGPILELVEL